MSQSCVCTLLIKNMQGLLYSADFSVEQCLCWVFVAEAVEQVIN